MQRSFLSAAIAAGIVMTTGLANAQSVELDPVENYWMMFGTPDKRVDVYSALDRNGDIVLTTTLDQHTYELFWFAETQSFEMLVDGTDWVLDLRTFEDRGKRPNFGGWYDEFGTPGLSGFVDLSPDGPLMVQVTAPGSPTQRTLVVNNVVLDSTKCVCFGTSQNKEECSDSDCDVSEDCNAGNSGTAYCRWKYLAIPASPR